jgi:hypothetical protein
MTFRVLAAGLALLAASATASAQYSIVPAQPQEFDSVVLRMTVDSCVFDIDRIGVSALQDVLVVTARVRNCLVPGPLRVIDVRLGTLPIGSYRAVLIQATGDLVFETPPSATIPFNVVARPTIAIFPPPKKPLNDYTGNWIVPTELGWGLTILQSPAHTVFAQLFVYGANRLPEWFTFQAGQWKSATRWEGAVYASTGPAWSNPAFDPAQVSTLPVGTATLEFEQLPGSEGLATLVYTVGNVSVTKRIRRFAF